MFGNTVFEIGNQKELVLSNHLVTNIDISKLDTSTFILLVAAIGVVGYSIGNIVYVYYYLSEMKENIVFRAIPNYFKTLSETQKIDMIDNEQYYR